MCVTYIVHRETHRLLYAHAGKITIMNGIVSIMSATACNRSQIRLQSAACPQTSQLSPGDVMYNRTKSQKAAG
jgi:hypothetical protein